MLIERQNRNDSIKYSQHSMVVIIHSEQLVYVYFLEADVAHAAWNVVFDSYENLETTA